jgi:hypothetical protein
VVKIYPDLYKVVEQHFLSHPLAASVDVINPLSKRQISQAAAVFSDLPLGRFASSSTEGDENSA